MKNFLTFILTLIFCFSFANVVCAKAVTFDDVNETDWYYHDLSYLVEKDVIHGLSATEFAPDRPITRGEFVTVLSAAAKVDISGFSGETAFSDVSAADWYGKNVQWASENGLIFGKSPSAFAPQEQITREEAALILYRYDQLFGGIDFEVEGVLFADDANISLWAKDAVYDMQKKDVIHGSGGKFYPQNNLLRCEALALFANYLNHLTCQTDQEYNGIHINAGDIIVYSEKAITDEDELYELATSMTSLSATTESANESLIQYNATLSENSGNTEGIKASSSEEDDVPVYEYTQHYMTVQKEDGTISDYYTTDVFADVPQGLTSETESVSTSSYPESTNTVVSPGEYDGYYSARAWAKICYEVGRTGGFDSPRYVKALWFRGTVQQYDSSVRIDYRRLWFRNKGYNAFNTNAYQNITLGPYYASSGSETITKNAPPNFYALEYNFHEIVCTCQAHITKGSREWDLQATIAVMNDPL